MFPIRHTYFYASPLRRSVLWCCQKVLSWTLPCQGASQQETSLQWQAKGVCRIPMGRATVAGSDLSQCREHYCKPLVSEDTVRCPVPPVP